MSKAGHIIVIILSVIIIAILWGKTKPSITSLQGELVSARDARTQAETAQRADVPFLLFTDGYRKTPIEEIPHTYSFSSFNKLPELVEKILENTNR